MGSLGIQTPQNNYHIPAADKAQFRWRDNPLPDGPPQGSLLPAGPSFRPVRRVDGMQQQHRRTPAGGSRQVEREERRGVIRGRRPLVARLTEDIVSTYTVCNPNFRLPKPQKWYLTRPSQGVRNDGQDNEHSDLILYHNCVLVDSAKKTSFQVKNMLGKGAFGQACRCSTSDLRYPDFVAVKVIKNDPDYTRQAQHEIGICYWLKSQDPENTHHIYRILNAFIFEGHICLVFELLGLNLIELLAANRWRGVSTNVVQVFTRQILEALVAMGDAGVIHRDLKPENILLLPDPSQIKVIDFGSACTILNKGNFTYIQSRFYRSPEVLLHLPYTAAIDMWSLGCVAAELFLGRPLFPAGCNYDLFRFMIDVLGSQPPDYIIGSSKEECRSRFFKLVSSAPLSANMRTDVRNPAFQLLSEAEYEAREKKKPQVGKRPFGDKKLEEMIIEYQIRTVAGMQGGVEKEMKFRESFIDFLKGVLNFDHFNRWTAKQALQHPFITGEELAEWQPPREQVHSYNGNGTALNNSWPAIGSSPHMHFNGTAYHPGLQASPDLYNSMLSSTSNGPGMGSSLGSMVDSPGPGYSSGGYAESTGIHHIYPYSPGAVVNGHHLGLAGGYASSPDTYLQNMSFFNRGQPFNVRPPNNQLGFLGGLPTPPYQVNPFSIYGSPTSSSYLSQYGSHSSSVHHSPVWSVGSGSNPYGSPSSESQFSPMSLFSPNRLVPTFPATVPPSAGNSTRQRFSPGAQHDLSRNQHPDNGNVSLMRDAVPRPNIRNGPGASRTAHVSSSSTGARVDTLPPALNLPVNSYIPEGSEALLFSPDPRYSGEPLLGFSGEASSSKGRSVPEVSTGKSDLSDSDMVPGDPGEESSPKLKSVRVKSAGIPRKSRLGNLSRASTSSAKHVSYYTMVAGGPVAASSSSGKDLSYSTMVAGDAGEVPSSTGRVTNDQSTGISRLPTALFRLSIAKRSSGDPGETSSSSARGVSEQSTGIPRNLSYSNMVGGQLGQSVPLTGQSRPQSSAEGHPSSVPNSNSNSRGTGHAQGQSTASTGQSRSKVEIPRNGFHTKR